MKKIFLSLALSLACISFAYTSEDTSNAHYLADQGIITKQTVTSKYRLDDKILRQEVIGMALKVKGVTLPENYTCKKYFADATKNDWICRAVELAADNGIITRSNKYANPGKYVTRAEALAMIYNASGLIPGEMGIITYGDNDIVTWQKQLFSKIYATGIAIPGIKKILSSDESNITLYFYPNRLATRAEVFGFAKNILMNIQNETGEFCKLEGLRVGAPCWVNNQRISFGDQIKDEIGYEGPECSISYTFGSIQHSNAFYGAPSLTEFYARSGKVGAIDVSYDFPTSIILGEKGYYILGGPRDKCSDKITFYNVRKVGNSDVLAIYYAYLDNNFYDFSYLMRFPVGVSRETFESWYKNTESVTFREDTLKDLGDNTYEFLVDMVESGKKSTYKVKSKVNLEKFTIDNISSVKQ